MREFDICRPDEIRALIGGRWHELPGGVKVAVESGRVTLEAPDSAVEAIGFRWKTSFEKGALFFGDAWERGYGDLCWRPLCPERSMPWYMEVSESGACSFIGVKTGCSAFVNFMADTSSVTMIMDVRSGCEGVRLGSRRLELCEVVSVFNAGKEPYAFLCANLKTLCDAPRLPKGIVYGGNNWYYAYGKSSKEQILRDSRFMAEMADGLGSRPYMVIDDGWQKRGLERGCNGGPWTGNGKYGDMGSLASLMSEAGVRPGIWFRPLYMAEKVPGNWLLKKEGEGFTLDPSVPDVIEYVFQTARLLSSQGYELIKHDFTTYDFMGDWGFVRHGDRLGKPVKLSDTSKTNAEHIKTLYDALRRGAGNSVVIGCNTVSHLAAGYFELQRTGDDTSGREWERTRYMGVNTLAMRMPQHMAFYASDADCAGVTDDVPWELNSQWLELLSKSGTPLFVSADPLKQNAERRTAIREAFKNASEPHEAAAPLDWMDTTCPTRWRMYDGVHDFNWTDWYSPGPGTAHWR